MPIPIGVLAAAGAGDFRLGYVAGGQTSGNVRQTAVEKYSFVDDTRSTLATGLSSARFGAAGMANSNVAAYFGGGQVGATGNNNTSGVDKFVFSNDTRSTLASGLSSARVYLSGFANSGTAGYFAGGRNNSADAITTVDKFAFANDSRTTLATGLSIARLELAGMANSGTAGYVGGGFATGTTYSTVDKFAFSNDSRTTLSSGLATESNALVGFANSGTAGYFGGGTPQGSTLATRTVWKFTFSNDSRTTFTNSLVTARKNASAMANSGFAGYIISGINASNVFTASTEKFTFSTDTSATSTAMPTALEYTAAAASSGTL